MLCFNCQCVSIQAIDSVMCVLAKCTSLVAIAALIIGNESAPIQLHSAGSLGWPFPMLKYESIFQVKYTETILSNSTGKLLWFEITKMLIAA